MKLAIATLLLAAAAFGQQTKGPITITKDGDATHTVVKVTSVTPGRVQFNVTITYKTATVGLEFADTKTVTRPIDTKFHETFAIFDVAVDNVVSIGVSQYLLDDVEVFNQ